ncbi:HIT family protein, partial [Candidatus Woesearchaeota archaeon]|nr:HIT family protein [Candidatus Woesearchaeota archaeon]
MSKECGVCKQIADRKHLLYENDKAAAFLSTEPATIGHIIIAPKQHTPILEQVPDFIVSELFATANKLSITCFESLGAEGTNIIVQNGIAAGQTSSHVTLNIVPRKEGDNLPLVWKPRPLSEEEMSTVELKVKEETKKIGSFENEKPKPVEIEKPKEIKPT